MINFVQKKVKNNIPPLTFNKKHQGALITKIEFLKLYPYGPNVFDTNQIDLKWYERIPNKMHIQTKDKVIQRNLIVHEGDLYDYDRIKESERILRSIRSVRDVRVYIEQFDSTQNTLVLKYVIKDLASKNAGFDLRSIDYGTVNLNDRNFLGFTHEFRNRFTWNMDQLYPYTYDGAYMIKNQFGKFFDSEFKTRQNPDNTFYQVNSKRPFYTHSVRYAGGLNFLHNHSVYNEETRTMLRFLQYDLWLAKSVPVNQNNELTKAKSSFVYGGGFNAYRFHDGPTTTEESNYIYQSRNLALATIAFSKQGYFRTNYLYNFGRTEDIPYGHLFSWVVGYEDNIYGPRGYFAFHADWGSLFPSSGVFRFNFETGSFLRSGNFEQTIFKGNIRYFSNLIYSGNSKIRQFVKLGYTYGTNLYQDEFTTLNRSSGIRFFSSSLLRNTQKLVLNLETVYFLPKSFLGFKSVLFAFADIGYLGDSDSFIFDHKLYKGFGLGWRIRNDKLVFKTIQIQLGIYPGSPMDVQNTLWHISRETRLDLDNFFLKQPRIIGLNE